MLKKLGGSSGGSPRAADDDDGGGGAPSASRSTAAAATPLDEEASARAAEFAASIDASRLDELPGGPSFRPTLSEMARLNALYQGAADTPAAAAADATTAAASSAAPRARYSDDDQSGGAIHDFDDETPFDLAADGDDEDEETGGSRVGAAAMRASAAAAAASAAVAAAAAATEGPIGGECGAQQSHDFGALSDDFVDDDGMDDVDDGSASSSASESPVDEDLMASLGALDDPYRVPAHAKGLLILFAIFKAANARKFRQMEASERRQTGRRNAQANAEIVALSFRRVCSE